MLLTPFAAPIAFVAPGVRDDMSLKMIEAQITLGKFADARRSLESARGSTGKTARFLFLDGVVLAIEARGESAETLLADAMKLSETDGKTRIDAAFSRTVLGVLYGNEAAVAPILASVSDAVRTLGDPARTAQFSALNASVKIQKGEKIGAIALLRATRAQVDALPDAQKATTLIYRARAFRDADLSDDALKEATDAQKAADSAKDLYTSAEAKLAQVGVLYDQDKYDDALAKADLALDEFTALGARREMVRAHSWRSRILRMQDKNADAASAAKAGRTVLEAAGAGLDRQLLISLHAEEADAFVDDEKIDAATVSYGAAISLARALKKPDVEASLLIDLAQALINVEKNKDAETALDSALIVARGRKDAEQEGDVLIWLGYIYSETEREAKAKATFTDAIALYGKAKKPGDEADARERLARLLLDDRDFSGAVREMETAVGLYKQAKDTRGEGQAHLRISMIHGAQENWDAAISSSEKSVAVFVASKESRGEVSALLTLAGWLARSERWGRVLEIAEQARALGEKLSQKQIQARAYLLLAGAHGAQGNVESAKLCVQKARELAPEMFEKS